MPNKSIFWHNKGELKTNTLSVGCGISEEINDGVMDD